jgi:hypothetical protein
VTCSTTCLSDSRDHTGVPVQRSLPNNVARQTSRRVGNADLQGSRVTQLQTWLGANCQRLQNRPGPCDLLLRGQTGPPKQNSHNTPLPRCREQWGEIHNLTITKRGHHRPSQPIRGMGLKKRGVCKSKRVRCIIYHTTCSVGQCPSTKRRAVELCTQACPATTV